MPGVPKLALLSLQSDEGSLDELLSQGDASPLTTPPRPFPAPQAFTPSPLRSKSLQSYERSPHDLLSQR